MSKFLTAVVTSLMSLGCAIISINFFSMGGWPFGIFMLAPAFVFGGWARVSWEEVFKSSD